MRIKMFFEYKCYPIWIYNKEGDLVDNSLPKDFEVYGELNEKLIELQEKYDQLFTDDGIEFKFNGFDNNANRELFLEDVKCVTESIKEKLSNEYDFEIIISGAL